MPAAPTEAVTLSSSGSFGSSQVPGQTELLSGMFKTSLRVSQASSKTPQPPSELQECSFPPSLLLHVCHHLTGMLCPALSINPNPASLCPEVSGPGAQGSKAHRRHSLDSSVELPDYSELYTSAQVPPHGISIISPLQEGKSQDRGGPVLSFEPTRQAAPT